MSGASTDRGQANTLAIAIVLVLALGSALAVVGIGSLTLDEGRGVAETQSGLHLMTELDSRASLVALEGGDATTMDLDTRGGDGRVSVDRTGQLRLVMRNTTTGDVIWRNETTLGTVTYESGSDRIAYQGGGVWRRTAGAEGSVMVSPPEIHYRRGTLTLPMINVTGTDSGIRTARMRRTGEEQIYPEPSRGRNWTNPVAEGNELVLFVRSDYYRGWERFFDRRIGGNVTAYPANRTVRVELVAPVSRFRLASGLISVGGGAPIDMRGNGGNPTFLDSYDSSSGDYASTAGGNGTVRSPGGLELGGESYIRGTVNTGGTLGFSGNSNTIYGDAYHQGLSQPQNGVITGVERENGSGVDVAPIDGTVTERVNSICAGGDALPDGTATVDATGDARYCQDGDLRLNGETLTVDVSAGNVSLAVDGDLILKGGGEIEVVGTAGNDNTAKLWLGGDTVELTSSAVTVADEESTAFRLFAGSGTSVSLRGSGGGGSRFVGLLFAPTTRGAGGGLSMQSDSDLYGAAVVGSVNMRSGSAVHYDRALGGFAFPRTGQPASRLSYLLVSINEVEVEER